MITLAHEHRSFFGCLALVFAACPCALAQYDCSGIATAAGDGITAELVSEDLDRPVDVVSPPGDTERLFVVEQRGRIRIIELDGDRLVSRPFLDIRDRVRCCGERGLLGMDFHPDYDDNGYFFVYYTRTIGDVCATSPPLGCSNNRSAESVVSRFQVSGDDADVADAASELPVLSFCQPYSNHNGGQLRFGPVDGYLYIGTGDGGSGGDPCGSGQRRNSLLGKLLRIDVDNSSADEPYGIPPENPFVGVAGVREEIWALGLRNPWRWSFDVGNEEAESRGDLYIGDVGQGQREEVDYQPASSTGGENYEWRRIEGTRTYNSGTSLSIGQPVGPIFEYEHSSGALRGCSITGGVVYRGCAIPDLRGTYFFAEYCDNWIQSFRVVDGQLEELRDRTDELNDGIAPDDLDDISAFGVDGRGEIYICDLSTKLFRIVPTGPVGDAPPNARVVTDPSPAELVLEGETVEVLLDGSSSDDGGDGSQDLTWAWSKIAGPEGDEIEAPNAATTVLTLSRVGEYRYELRVGDGSAEDRVEVEVLVSTPPLPVFRRGDGNVDGVVDISDGMRVLFVLFLGGSPLPCLDAADTNDSGEIDVSDAVAVLSYLFSGGMVSPPPGPRECGPDPTTDDSLGCAEYLSCS